jgi:hypothetical protein
MSKTRLKESLGIDLPLAPAFLLLEGNLSHIQCREGRLFEEGSSFCIGNSSSIWSSRIAFLFGEVLKNF